MVLATSSGSVSFLGGAVSCSLLPGGDVVDDARVAEELRGGAGGPSQRYGSARIRIPFGVSPEPILGTIPGDAVAPPSLLLPMFCRCGITGGVIGGVAEGEGPGDADDVGKGLAVGVIGAACSLDDPLLAVAADR